MKKLLLILLIFNKIFSFSQRNSEKMDIILVPKIDMEYNCEEIDKWNNGVIQSVKDYENGGYELKIKLDSGVRLTYEMCTYADACEGVPNVYRSWIPYAAVPGKRIKFKAMACGSGGILNLTRIVFNP
jgi:hypothetical protein